VWEHWTKKGNRDASYSCSCDRGLHWYLRNFGAGGGLNPPKPPLGTPLVTNTKPAGYFTRRCTLPVYHVARFSKDQLQRNQDCGFFKDNSYLSRPYTKSVVCFCRIFIVWFHKLSNVKKVTTFESRRFKCHAKSTRRKHVLRKAGRNRC